MALPSKNTVCCPPYDHKEEILGCLNEALGYMKPDQVRRAFYASNLLEKLEEELRAPPEKTMKFRVVLAHACGLPQQFIDAFVARFGANATSSFTEHEFTFAQLVEDLASFGPGRVDPPVDDPASPSTLAFFPE